MNTTIDVPRHIIKHIEGLFVGRAQKGLILTGIVGAGKTFLINKLCDNLRVKENFDILKYTGDDVAFRKAISGNSRLISEEILEKGLRKPLVFIDEIQKEPDIYDAVKIAFDENKASFIVSGSNPSFLNTTAKNRLQRRADSLTLKPFFISEILNYLKVIKEFKLETFIKILTEFENINKVDFDIVKKEPIIDKCVEDFLSYGGLPLAFLAKGHIEKLNEIKLTAERGITETYTSTIALDDEVRIFLAEQNSREFTYKGLNQKLRSTRRDIADKVIDHLMNHGYLLKKRPYLFDYELTKSTYYAVYSWIDSGIASYYCGGKKLSDAEQGFFLEAYVHNVIDFYQKLIPLKTEVFYYKNFQYKKVNDSLLFKPGEVDFIFKIGDRIIPIEVKKTSKISEIDFTMIEQLNKKYKLPYGIIIYGGSPFVDKAKKILYYPYWLI